MTTKQQEAFDAVQKINDELFLKYNDSTPPTVSITFANRMIFISVSLPDLPEIHVYNSEDDDRIYYEDGDTYESFYDFIKRKFNFIKEEIYAIEL